MDPRSTPHDPHGRLDRRRFIAGGAGALGALGLGIYGAAQLLGDEGTDAVVSAPERLRAAAGRELEIVAEPATIELGRRTAETWTYSGTLHGPEIRVRQGERVRVRLRNELAESTTIHWHGVRLENAVDGVPDLTQRTIGPGLDFVYEFVAPDAGTFMYHPHVGVQIDRGLYGPLIVEARDEPGRYDLDAMLMFDDWLDGIAGTPDEVLQRLRNSGMDMGEGQSGGMEGMDMGEGEAGGEAMRMGAPAEQRRMARHRDLGRRSPGADSLARLANLMERGLVDVGDVEYPLHLVNGRPPESPYSVRARRGQRVRLRLANIAGDTHYCVFVEGHELQITHADGSPVRPVSTDAVLLGMGERYDVAVDVGDAAAARIIAVPLGKRGRAVALLRTRGARGRASDPEAPFPMPERIASYEDLRDAEEGDAVRSPRILRLPLEFEEPYTWKLGGGTHPDAAPLRVRRGQAVRLVFENRTRMPHPMHLHGHFFRTGPGGARKDTITVLPRRTASVELVADNPGRWALHCHNVYHQEAGMMRELRVG